MLITTTRGEIDDALLQKREDVWDDDDYHITAVEYCAIDCQGTAHATGVAHGAGCFCEFHVRRDAHVTAKRWPQEIGATAASLP